MARRQKYPRILSRLLPAGTVGMWLLLGASVPAGAVPEPASAQPPAAGQPRVAERLAAVREAVSGVAEPGAEGGGNRLAWWAWRNGGGGGAWRNGGWRNGGWRNGGWHNGWPNFWRNW